MYSTWNYDVDGGKRIPAEGHWVTQHRLRLRSRSVDVLWQTQHLAAHVFQQQLQEVAASFGWVHTLYHVNHLHQREPPAGAERDTVTCLQNSFSSALYQWTDPLSDWSLQLYTYLKGPYFTPFLDFIWGIGSPKMIYRHFKVKKTAAMFPCLLFCLPLVLQTEQAVFACLLSPFSEWLTALLVSFTNSLVNTAESLVVCLDRDI